MSVFDDILAAGVAVAFDYHGEAATHVDAETGASTACTVLLGDEEVVEGDQYAVRHRSREHRRLLAVRTGEVADPKRGDRFAVGAAGWAVVGVDAADNGVAVLRCERDERVHAGGRRL